MKTKDFIVENKTTKAVKKFLPWLCRQLDLDITKLPKITFLDRAQDKTFGQYDPTTRSLYIVTGDRHPVDVLRTLAHELTHYKQDLKGDLTPGAGETGTDQENEANANAGIVMRDFAQAHPEQLGLPEELSENFADGKKPGRKGLAKRIGVNTKASVSTLRNVAKHSTGEKARMAHWMANMKAGRAKKKH